MGYLESQFSNPRGLIGHLVGVILAIENRERNQWALSLLNIQPTDRLLEIGFGPGWAIQKASQIAIGGWVAGVDHSIPMVNQARFRNRRGVRAGQVELRLGMATAIPFEDESFDKVYTVNSFHEWADSATGLQEAKRVLKPGGLIAIVEHPHGKIGEQEIEAMRMNFFAQLQQARFQSIRFRTNQVQGRYTIAVLGNR